VKSGGVQLVLQAAVGNGLSFDPFSFCQNGWAASELLLSDRRHQLRREGSQVLAKVGPPQVVCVKR